MSAHCCEFCGDQVSPQKRGRGRPKGSKNRIASTAGAVAAKALERVRKETDTLLPVTILFPGRSPRWVADSCRAGRIPGAVKIGKSWFTRASDVDRLVKAEGTR